MVQFKIIKTEEKNNRLTVEIEVDEKTESYVFPVKDIQENEQTKKPMFVHRIKEILERRLKPKQTKIKKKDLQVFEEQSFNTDELEDLSKKGLAQIRKQKDIEKGDQCHEKLHKAEWDKFDIDLRARRKTKRDEKIRVQEIKQKKEIKDKSLKTCKDCGAKKK